MIFSLVKTNTFRITSVVFIVSLRDADSTSLFFLTSLTSLFLSKTIKCWYAFYYLECKEHFSNKIILMVAETSCSCISSTSRVLSTERRRRRRDAHILLGDELVMTSETRMGMQSKTNTLFQ